jgi:hypothetical protein
MMAAEPASAAEDRFVDAVARRVVELLRGGDSRDGRQGGAAETDSPCLTVSQVAARYRVSRSWVYAHQRELGAMRLGDGPRARLRFDPRVVAEAIAGFDRSRDQVDLQTTVRRWGSRGGRLIEFEQLE